MKTLKNAIIFLPSFLPFTLPLYLSGPVQADIISDTPSTVLVLCYSSCFGILLWTQLAQTTCPTPTHIPTRFPPCRGKIGRYRAFHPQRAEWIFFSRAYEIFPKIDPMIGHKISLNKFIVIISSIFPKHNGMKLEIDYKAKTRGKTKTKPQCFEAKQHATKQPTGQ